MPCLAMLLAFFFVTLPDDERPDDDAARVFTVDVVHLLETGQEQPGDPDRSARHEGFTYHFASDATRDRFAADPQRFAVRLGGACGRMGALSGLGRADLHTVHAGKLYIFASPGCREAFLKSPKLYLEHDAAPPEGDSLAAERGRHLVSRAVVTHGGPRAIAALTNLRQEVAGSTEYEGRTVRTDKIITLAYPDRMRYESYWGDKMWARTLVGERGAFLTESGLDRQMTTEQVRACRRAFNGHLLTILKATRRPDFRAVQIYPAGENDPLLDHVAVWFDGCAATLGIESETGRVRTITRRDWGGTRGVLGNVTTQIVDYETVHGVLLPRKYTRTMEGEATGKAVRLAALAGNVPLADTVFSVGE